MGSSYYITYGGDRLTFPGATGSVAWEFEHPMVMLFPGAALTNDYLKMRFVTPDSQEIILEAGSGTTASASARVPVGSTAYWTANGYQDHTGIKWHVSALYNTGFSGVSANTAVTTSFYENPNSESDGSAILTATGSASATVSTFRSYRATFGEGGSTYHVAFSASSFVGNYLSPLGASLRTAWIPKGSEVLFSASSLSGTTYSLNPSATALNNFAISWNHQGSGSRMDVTGNMNTAISFRLGSGRPKRVYATGYNRVLGAAQGTASAAIWQPLCIITSFSSNLNTGSSLDTYLVGSANAGDVHGFASGPGLGVMMNSAGTWSSITSGTNTYKWNNRYFISNSAFFSGTFSAMRTKGPTGSNNATYVFYGKDANNASVSRVSGQFAVPTASGKTSTKTASGRFSTNTLGVEAFAIMSNAVAGRTSLCANCVGHYTASGVVV